MSSGTYIRVRCLRPSCKVSGIELAFVPEHVDEARRKCWKCKSVSLRIQECDPPKIVGTS